MNLETKKKLLVEYLLLKVDEGDWHAVADVAMDLRELEVEIKMMRDKQTQPASGAYNHYDKAFPVPGDKR